MTAFLLSASGLCALALLILLRPWWRPEAARPSAGELRRRVYLAQRAELARDREAGLIEASQAASAEAELQRRWLEEAALPAAGSPGAGQASAHGYAHGDVHADAHGDPHGDVRSTARAEARAASSTRGAPRPAGRDATPWVLALAIPLLGALGYAWRGHPEGWDVRGGAAGVSSVTATVAAGPAAASALPEGSTSAPVTAATIEQMVGRLAARLHEHPDDPAGWTRLARAYRVMGRASDARQAYEQVGPGLQDDATMLAEYADSIVAMRGGLPDADASRALRRALQVDPRNPMALSLAATVAWNARDYAEAARRWRTLLQVLPPDAHDAETVREFLEQAERRARPAGAASRAGAAGSGAR